MAMNHLRWGILGTANIARKNWKAILNSGNCVATAVASRDLERSRQFVAECQQEAPFRTPPAALGSYEQLVSSNKVDAIYIPLPTGLRKGWVLRAAQAGKHVLCEKPCAAGVADLHEMIAACRQHRVQFMDGVMFMHSRRLERIREALDDGASIGAIRRITTQFSFRASEDFLAGGNIRMNNELEPHGSLGDLGWYCIRFALWAMNWQLPRRVRAETLSTFSGTDEAAAVPTEFSAELFFDGGVSSSFYCSFLAEHQQWANVSGTKGCLYVPDFVLPFSGSALSFEVNRAEFRTGGCDFIMDDRTRKVTVEEHANSHPTAQESNMFRNFANQVRSGQLNEQWPAIALKTQQVMEECLDSALSNGPAG